MTRQRETLLVLLNNMNTAYGLQSKEAASAGSAMARYATYAESTEAKVNDLNNALQQLWMKTLNSNVINEAISTVTGLVNIFNNFGGLIPIIAGVISGVLTVAIIGLIGMLQALETEGLKINVLFGGLPIVIGLVVTALTAVGFAIANNINSQENLIKKQNELNDSYKSQIESIDKAAKGKDGDAKVAETLAKKVEELTSKEKLNTAEKAQMKNIVGQLNKLLPDLNLQIDKQTGKIIGNTSAIYDNIKALKEQALAQAYQQKTQVAATAAIDQEELLGKTKNELDKKEKELIDLKNKDYTIQNSQTVSVGKQVQSHYGLIDKEKEVDKLRSLVNEQSNQLDKYNQNIDDYTKKALEHTKTPETPKPPDWNPEGDGSGGKGTPEEKQPDEKLIEKDRYYAINKLINEYNNLIAQQKAIYENANPKQKLDILEKEDELYKKLQTSIHLKAEEERKERSELASSLSKSGVKFTGAGDNITATNADDILANKLAAVNAHRSDKNKTYYNQLKADYDEYKTSLDRFFEIQSTDLKNASKDWFSYEQSIQSNHKETLNLLFSDSENTVSNLDNLIKDAENKLKGLSDKDSDKRISAYQTEIDNAKLAVNYWKSQLELFKESPELTQKAIEKMQQYDATIQSASKSISDMVNKQISLSVKGIDDIIKQEDDAHKKRLDNIATEKKAFDDSIDGQIKKIEEQKSAEDYTDDVNKITKELTELQQKRDKLTMAVGSGDSEALTQVKELNKQIQEKQDELTKKQKDRDFNVRKENLQDLKRTNDDAYDSKKETEDKAYQAVKDNYDKMKMEIDNFTSAGTDATTTMVDNIISSYKTLETSFSTSTQNMATIFGTKFLSQLQNAKTQISSISSSLGFSNSNESSIVTGKTIADYQKMYADAKSKGNWQGMEEANKQANLLRNKGAIVTATADIAKVKLESHHSGVESGLVGGGSLPLKQGEILSKLTSGELIINPPQVNNLFNNLASLVTPKFATNTGYGDITTPINIYVSGNLDKSVVPTLENSFASILKNRFNNSGIMR